MIPIRKHENWTKSDNWGDTLVFENEFYLIRICKYSIEDTALNIVVVHKGPIYSSLPSIRVIYDEKRHTNRITLLSNIDGLDSVTSLESLDKSFKMWEAGKNTVAEILEMYPEYFK